MTYRADIDGLRALAVVPVVLFHASVPHFSGGYVGVDVFFVISGFLLTHIIASEIADGTFSAADFYVRRIRRILPALIAMLAATLAVGAVIFLPADYQKLGQGTLAALFSSSNILFFRQAGYFDESAIVKPLLHTWSLAVEEQFYLCLPLLLLVMKRGRPNVTRLAVLLVALASIALAIIAMPGSQAYAYYRLPPRAWEFLAGSLLALGSVPQLGIGRLRGALALLGAALIIAPVFVYSVFTPFPGLSAVPPVMGAVLLIHCAPNTFTGRALSLSLPRAVGRISYSLYLWHWPVIVFTTYYNQRPLTPVSSVAVVLVSTLLAALSWKFVEQPFRARSAGATWLVFAGAVVAIAIIGIISAGIVQASGLPWRFTPDVARYAAAAAISPQRSGCHDDPKRKVSPANACRLGSDTPPSVAIWSDSHGIELAYALAEVGKRNGFSLLQLTSSACPPGIRPMRNDSYRPRCVQHNEAVLKFLKDHPTIKTVVLTAAWEAPRMVSTLRRMDGIRASVTALRAAGRKVIVIGPNVTQPFDVPRAMQLAVAFGRPPPNGREVSDFLMKTKRPLDFLKGLEKEGVSVVFPHLTLCDRTYCPPARDGKMLYVDDNHPSIYAARIIAALIVPMLPERVSGEHANAEP